MKQVFIKTSAELKKSYTSFAAVLIFIAAISSFFTTIQIFKDNDLRTIFQMLYVASSAAGLMIVLLPSLVYLEEYLQTTKLSKFSIAGLFVKNANHALINVKTLLVLISAVYIVIAFMTGQVFAAAIIFWFMTAIAMIFE